MTTFASSFWSTDYAAGLGVLFGKLQQGVQENSQFITVARMRAEAEDAYGSKLGDIEGATNRIAGGFQRDDGASVKKVSNACMLQPNRKLTCHVGIRRRAIRDV